MPVFQDNSESIGRTPLVKINRLTEGLKATVLAKIEGRICRAISPLADGDNTLSGNRDYSAIDRR